MIGTSLVGGSNTNVAPQPQSMTLAATVSGLIPGTSYNLYRYDFSARPLLGSLNVPTANFNAHASLASERISFVASASTYTTVVNITSDRTVVFRAVSASAP
jgi:hypothetical protein